jgi:hypothetical protein
MAAMQAALIQNRVLHPSLFLAQPKAHMIQKSHLLPAQRLPSQTPATTSNLTANNTYGMQY